jgi:hypothetical protein
MDELETIRLRKISQAQKTKYHMFSLFLEPRPKMMMMKMRMILIVMDMNVFGGLFGIRSLGEGKEMTRYRA